MAIETNTMATFDAFLHEYYVDGKMMIIADAYENKLLTAMPKSATATGKGWNFGVPVEQANSAAGNYGIAKAFAQAGADVEFTGKWKDRFGFCSLDDKLIRMSQNSEGAYEPALTSKIESTRANFLASVNYQLFRTEDGDIGRLSTFVGNDVVATGTLSVNTREAASMRLKTGVALRFGSTRGGAVSAGYWTVANIQDDGVIGLQAPVSGAAVPVAGDYVYIYGDERGNTASSATTSSLAGLESWVPGTQAEASADFKGVARGLYGAPAQGIRVTATGKRPSEVLQLAGIRGRQHGAKLSHVFLHPTRFAELCSELGGQQRFGTVAGKTAVKLTKKEAERFGFSALQLANGGGDLMIIDDWACQYAYSWALELNSFSLVHDRGGFPKNRGEGTDGLKMLRSTSDNSYLFELNGYGELQCRAPGHNVCIVHSTAA